MAVPAPSHKTNLFFVRLLTDWTLREIAELFAGNGLSRTVESFPNSRWPIGSSQRRTEAVEFLEAVDLSDERQRASLLRVFSDVLSQMPAGDQRDRLQQLLEEDGVDFSGTGRIDPKHLRAQERGGRLEAALPDFKLITDPDVLREHAERMQRASLGADAPDAILAARELLETVCKLVCEDCGVQLPRNPNLGELYHHE